LDPRSSQSLIIKVLGDCPLGSKTNLQNTPESFNAIVLRTMQQQRTTLINHRRKRESLNRFTAWQTNKANITNKFTCFQSCFFFFYHLFFTHCLGHCSLMYFQSVKFFFFLQKIKTLIGENNLISDIIFIREKYIFS